ncbi:uncharacterized protein LOC136086424 [Hydra vulgaris]|uniref:Uncharacterized protein LOC136086424 n=1 Tax=Hydra vulgaris TaxID=6087 RepID=A0ABM4CSB9_HYDVU
MYCRQLIALLHERNWNWHIEPTRRWKQAMLYCCKTESRVSPDFYSNVRAEVKVIVIPKLVEIKRYIDRGYSMSDVMNKDEFFSSWCSHNRSLTLYANSKQKKRMFKSICIYLYGPPGCGKSRLAFDISRNCFPDTLPFYKNKSQWWDMYSQEHVVTWDDFRGDCYEPQELFKLCDRYDYKV